MDLMSVTKINELECIVISDLQDKYNNLIIIKSFLNELYFDVGFIYNKICFHGQKIQFLNKLLEILSCLKKQQIELENGDLDRELQIYYNYINEFDISYDDFIKDNTVIFPILSMLSLFQYIDPKILRALRKVNLSSSYNSFKTHKSSINCNNVIKLLISLNKNMDCMNNVIEDLEREKRKYQNSILKQQELHLLRELRESRNYYVKNTILLLEGLLETDGMYFHSLKYQLDTNYQKVVLNKLVKLNKLVNMQEKTYLDVKKINSFIKNFQQKNNKQIEKLN